MKYSFQWLLQPMRTLKVLLVYTLVLAAAFYVSYDLRFDFSVPPEFQHKRLTSLPETVVLQLICLVLLGQFGSLLTYFSIPDLLRIVTAMFGSGLILYLWALTHTAETALPRGVILIDFILSVGSLVLVRIGFRIYRERYANPKKRLRRAVRRVAILGAGDAGALLAGEALGKPALD